jgi:hypothetical protein
MTFGLTGDSSKKSISPEQQKKNAAAKAARQAEDAEKNRKWEEDIKIKISELDKALENKDDAAFAAINKDRALFYGDLFHNYRFTDPYKSKRETWVNNAETKQWLLGSATGKIVFFKIKNNQFDKIIKSFNESNLYNRYFGLENVEILIKILEELGIIKIAYNNNDIYDPNTVITFIPKEENPVGNEKEYMDLISNFISELSSKGLSINRDIANKSFHNLLYYYCNQYNYLSKEDKAKIMRIAKIFDMQYGSKVGRFLSGRMLFGNKTADPVAAPVQQNLVVATGGKKTRRNKKSKKQTKSKRNRK